MTIKRLRNERGTALLETAITLPILILVGVGIFEFGRAFQYRQVLTNAAREGARLAVTPSAQVQDVQNVVVRYMFDGGVRCGANGDQTCPVSIVNVNNAAPLYGGTGTGTTVQVAYPFNFMMLGGIVRLATGSSNDRLESFLMQTSVTMRNEG